MKTINNEIIRSFDPCYDPSTKGIPDNEELTVKEWVEKYKSVVPVSDIFWLLLRNEFYTDKQLRLFAVWCAREALKLVENPDQRSVDACHVAERFANGEATSQELDAASDAAWAAARAASDAARHAARDARAARHAARDAARHAASAARDAAREKQLNYLLTFELEVEL
jgi:pyruvate/2-oxoglutarate dehydrogenase complex dihydrolipoamide acyltransferase (E2) component